MREIAYEALMLFDKSELSNNLTKDILDKYSYLDKQDRSFLARLLEGTIERRITIDYYLDQFSKVKVNKMKPPVRNIMRLAVYQIMYMDSVPDSAAVNEAVKLARKRGLNNLTGFINGVLRNISRNKNKIQLPDAAKDAVKYMSIVYSCPEWIVKLLISEQGMEGAKSVLENLIKVSNIHGRVNISRISALELVDRINKESGQINASINELLPYAIDLHNINMLSSIAAFNEGLFTVSDISSMLVCHVAGIKPNDIVLDVCAAPGGKSMHAAMLADKGKVISCDVSDGKLDRIRENVERLGYGNVEILLRDASVFDEKLEETADVLIADLPCSGLGVMARKNDIKYRLKEEQLCELVTLQRKILRNVVRYLKKGGTLMFSTCTIHNAENIDNYRYIRDELGLKPVGFIDELPDRLKSQTAKEGYLQLLGKDALSDGFFISKFVK